MEDQRNYGDSSYKAYGAVYPYPKAVKGQKAEETITLTVVRMPRRRSRRT